MFLELRLLVRRSGLKRLRPRPLAKLRGAGLVGVSYGHYFNDRSTHLTFGDADVAGLDLTFPL
jgi:hypothetical protein